jgi:DNA-binding transcriptional regulator YiaG
MAQTKTKNRPKKKAASRFYVVRTIHDVRKNVTDRVENYHQELSKIPLRAARRLSKVSGTIPAKRWTTSSMTVSDWPVI